MSIPPAAPPLSYTETGSGTDALVFLHGNSQSSAIWDPQLRDPELQHRYRLLAPDLPGHGASAATGAYSFEDMTAALRAFLHALPIRRCILVGLSYGTNLIAESLAQLSGCAGAFLAAPDLVSNELPPSRVFRPLPELAVLVLPQADEEALAAYAQLLHAHPAPVRVDAFRRSYAATDPRFRAAIGTILAEERYCDEPAALEGAGIPFALVQGAEDPLLDATCFDALAKRAWGARVHRIPGAGHVVNEEAPQAFNALLARFAADAFTAGRA